MFVSVRGEIECEAAAASRRSHYVVRLRIRRQTGYRRAVVSYRQEVVLQTMPPLPHLTLYLLILLISHDLLQLNNFYVYKVNFNSSYCFKSCKLAVVVCVSTYFKILKLSKKALNSASNSIIFYILA
jgi:hypothetical protein